MSKFFLILMGIAMAAVLAVLVMGLVSMVKGGEFNRKYGNRLMRWRVGLQAIAIVLFAIALVLGRGS